MGGIMRRTGIFLKDLGGSSLACAAPPEGPQWPATALLGPKRLGVEVLRCGQLLRRPVLSEGEGGPREDCRRPPAAFAGPARNSSLPGTGDPSQSGAIIHQGRLWRLNVGALACSHQILGFPIFQIQYFAEKSRAGCQKMEIKI